MQDGDGQRQPLPHAERKAVGHRVDVGRQAEALDQRRQPGVGVGQLEQAGVQVQVLAHRQLAIEREGLRHVADAAAALQIRGVHRLAEQPRLAGAGGQEAGQHLHRGGLAAAVGPQEAEDLAAADAEADVRHRGEIAETAGQADRLDGRLRADGLGRAGRNGQAFVAAPGILRQQGDESLLQIGGAGLRLHRGGGVVGQQAAGVHHHHPVEALGLVHVGGGDQHRHAGAAGADTVDQLPELAAGERIDAGRRLVEDQQVGVVQQGAAQAELLLHAAGQLAGGAVGKGGEAGGLQQVGDAAPALRGVEAEEAAEELEVFGDAEFGVEVAAEPLRHVGDPRLERGPAMAVGNVGAEHADAALLDLLGGGDQAEQGRFADAVRTDDRDADAGGNVEGGVLQRHRPAIAVPHAGQRDGGGGGHVLDPCEGSPLPPGDRVRVRGVRGVDWEAEGV